MGKGSSHYAPPKEREVKPNMTCPVCGRRFRMLIVEGMGMPGKREVACGPRCRAIYVHDREGPAFADCY
jgi:C4-type Zn-finger protein